MSTTETPPRYFGKCTIKGCKHRRVIEPGSVEQLKLFPGPNGGTLTVLDDNGRDWPLHDIGGREQILVFRAAGLACSEHGTVVDFRRGQFTFNPDKVCNARCMGATGPACDCSCRGANHGGKHL
jgi:hypothetical protein